MFCRSRERRGYDRITKVYFIYFFWLTNFYQALEVSVGFSPFTTLFLTYSLVLWFPHDTCCWVRQFYSHQARYLFMISSTNVSVGAVKSLQRPRAEHGHHCLTCMIMRHTTKSLKSQLSSLNNDRFYLLYSHSNFMIYFINTWESSLHPCFMPTCP